MIKDRRLRIVISAALFALGVWTLLAATVGGKLTHPGVETAENTDPEEVLFDLREDVPVSEEVAVYEALPVTPGDAAAENSGIFQFIVTPEYFVYLSQRWGESLPLRNLNAEFTDDAVILTGDADVKVLGERLGIPSAVTLFLPDTVPCRLTCAPRVEEGCLRIRILKTSCDSDLLTPYLARANVAGAVEDFVNRAADRYLAPDYVLKSADLSPDGILVRFRLKNKSE